MRLHPGASAPLRLSGDGAPRAQRGIFTTRRAGGSGGGGSSDSGKRACRRMPSGRRRRSGRGGILLGENHRCVARAPGKHAARRGLRRGPVVVFTTSSLRTGPSVAVKTPAGILPGRYAVRGVAALFKRWRARQGRAIPGNEAHGPVGSLLRVHGQGRAVVAQAREQTVRPGKTPLPPSSAQRRGRTESRGGAVADIWRGLWCASGSGNFWLCADNPPPGRGGGVRGRKGGLGPGLPIRSLVLLVRGDEPPPGTL